MHHAKTLTACVAQTESLPGRIDANMDTHLDCIADARARGADLLLFPELSLVGHSPEGGAPDLALHRDDPRIARLAEAAGPMITVFGMIEEGPAAQFYNSAVMVRDGAVGFVHRKINLATYGALEEGKHYANGRYVETFDIAQPWLGSILICNDMWNPALVHLAALHGATCLLGPISSAVEAVGAEFDNPAGWETNIRFYSMTYGMPVLAANRVGREGGLTFWGGSRILDPFGRELARAGAGEELICARLDYAVLRRARYLLPTVRDSNLDLIRREIDRLVDIIGVPNLVRRL